MRTLTVASIVVLAASAAAAQELSWQEVAKRKELWPSTCTLKKSLQFQSGKSVKAGQKADVLDIQPAQVDLGALGMGFSVRPEDTDCLAVAQAAWGALTPAQRELTYRSIATRKDLWPYKVALTEPIELGAPDGRLQPGTQVVLFDADKSGKLHLITERTRTGFDLEPDATDLLAQVRKAVVDGPPSRMAGEMENRLVNPITGVPAPLNAEALPRYYLLYRGGGWCPYTRKLTPDVVKFYNEMHPQHPEFEAIYLPVDKSAAEMRAYAKEASFPWPAVAFERSKDLKILAPLLGPVPQLIVVDRAGKLVIADDTQASQDVLTKLRALLTQTASAR
ncbi:MAG TPA: thioredoxin-like domain-containing protein [Candidatus Polarisedimenticolaceae bacterium]|nr:thioredoxin-like domain-containing protein [Candidatus Polarisedimenticolaceae bacterium]